jgi:hypothetical protein
MAPGIGESLRFLFMGASKKQEVRPAVEEPVDYKGYTIQATPQKEGGQWLTAGVIAKEFDGTVKEHRFIRSDLHAGRTSAVEFSITKGQQIIDLDGDRIFD